MNSSTNSESALLSNASPTQSISKVKSRDNKENKLQRFGGAFVSGGTLVFGKIKSLWSHSHADVGLNMLADADQLRKKSKSKENLGFNSFLTCLIGFRFVFFCFFGFACDEFSFSF